MKFETRKETEKCEAYQRKKSINKIGRYKIVRGK